MKKYKFNSRTIEHHSRIQLFNDKMAFKNDEMILVNALDLCDELAEKDRLQSENIKLIERIENLKISNKILLDRQLVESMNLEPRYATYDIRGKIT